MPPGGIGKPHFLSSPQQDQSLWGRQGQRTWCTCNEPKKAWATSPLGLKKALLQLLCTNALWARVALPAFPLGYSSPVTPFKKMHKKEIGKNVDLHHCNRHNTCYCDSDPIKITLTLMFLCTLVEEKAQLAPFPLSHPAFASLKHFALQPASPGQCASSHSQPWTSPMATAVLAGECTDPSSSGLR